MVEVPFNSFKSSIPIHRYYTNFLIVVIHSLKDFLESNQGGDHLLYCAHPYNVSDLRPTVVVQLIFVTSSKGTRKDITSL